MKFNSVSSNLIICFFIQTANMESIYSQKISRKDFFSTDYTPKN